jgi:SAM-dependent methyltransferase
MIIPDSCLPWIGLQRTENPDYQETIFKDYERLKMVIPEQLECVIDIGCGIAGVDFYISKYHGRPELFLMDYTKRDPGRDLYGFKQEGKIYNSMNATKEFLDKNGVYNYHLIDCSEKYEVNKKADLIFSLLSCGFHYPVDVYMNFILEHLKKDGMLILDIRTGTDGINTVKQYFKDVEIIDSYNKHDKIIAREPI